MYAHIQTRCHHISQCSQHGILQGSTSPTAIPTLSRPLRLVPRAPPLLPLLCFRHSYVFPLPHPLPLLVPSLVAVVHLRRHLKPLHNQRPLTTPPYPCHITTSTLALRNRFVTHGLCTQHVPQAVHEPHCLLAHVAPLSPPQTAQLQTGVQHDPSPPFLNCVRFACTAVIRVRETVVFLQSTSCMQCYTEKAEEAQQHPGTKRT